jgi:diguanylate cyclase (GGDEF)-like protein
MGFELLTMVVVVGLMFMVGGIMIADWTLARAERRVQEVSGFQAQVAVDALTQAIGVAQTNTAALATNEQVVSLLSQPAEVLRGQPLDCRLQFQLAPFTGSHLDVVLPDGHVVCSSHPMPTDEPVVVDAPWLATAPDPAAPPGVSAIHTDALTGQPANSVSAPVRGPDGTLLGFVAAVLPAGGVAEQLNTTFDGGRGYRFAIVAAADRRLLSSGGGRDGRTAEGGTNDGGRVVTGSRVVEPLGWEVIASIRRASAMTNTRAALVRGLGLGAAALALLALLLLVVNRRIVRPLRRLADAVAAAHHPTAEGLPPVDGPVEVVRLADEFSEMLAARNEYETQLAHQALHDPLTGLPNRALLVDRLGRTLERATAGGRTVAVLFLDLDRFKLINDSLGHPAGDEALMIVADRLNHQLAPGDTVARFGGDEFVVVREAIAAEGEAELLAGALRSAVAVPIEVADTIVSVTASIGITTSRQDSTAESLLRDADTAMYEAKERGRARHQVFDRHLRTRATGRLLIDSELRLALEREELWVAYQPIADLTSGRFVGVESLLRWDHPALGSVPPSTFIPAAEESGLIVPIGQFVLAEACRQVAAWRQAGLDLKVSVNISGRQVADRALHRQVAEALGRSGLPGDALCIELTESNLMTDTARATATLRQLKELGVELSIDDFGTGYSSLSYLHRFPVDELKIDRGFVKDLADHREAGTTLVVAMVAMAKALGLRIVAEGVENPTQLLLLKGLDCDLAQGYQLGRPTSADKVEIDLRTNMTAALLASN